MGFLLTDEEVEAIVGSFDINKNGIIEYNEFITAMNVDKSNEDIDLSPENQHDQKSL